MEEELFLLLSNVETINQVVIFDYTIIILGDEKVAEPSKKDWKLYMEKIGGWQEHYMEKLVKEYADYLYSDLPASTKFWEMEKRIKRDRKTPGVRIELNKSRMFWDIAGLVQDKVISMDDLAEFSDGLKEAVALILDRGETKIQGTEISRFSDCNVAMKLL